MTEFNLPPVSCNSESNGHWRPLVLGHRGDSINFPENTLAALEGALQAGADGVECDVRLSGDGVPVLIHDSHLERTTDGRGRVSRQPLSRLKEFDAGDGERIPTLAEAADLYRGRGLLCIEFKEAEAVAPSIKALADAAAGDVVLCSFLPEALETCAEIAPKIPSMLARGSFTLNPIVRWREAFPLSTVGSVRASGLSCHRRFISRRLAASLKRRELTLYIWSTSREELNPPNWYPGALRLKPDAVITAWPGHLVDYLKQREHAPPGCDTG